MTDWIKVRANEVRRVENEKKLERERQIVAANELKAKTEPFWQELQRTLDLSIKEFNTEFSEIERRIDQFEKSAVALTIRRTSYPAATVKASFNTAGTSIQYSISVTHRKGGNPTEKQSTFAVGVANGEAGYSGNGVASHDDVAKVFLDPFFEFSTG